MSRTVHMSLAFVILAASTAFAAVGGATAQGISPDQLVAAGWTCFTDPGAPRTGAAIRATADRCRTIRTHHRRDNFKLFTLDGEFIGTSHLIRADLYRGQPCPPTGEPYFFIPPIGYYRCEHF